MRNIIRAALFAIVLLGTIRATAQAKNYKCMIQMNSYLGEGAYIVVSLMDEANNYKQTLYVLGADRKWYRDLKEWYKAYKEKPADISAITGASVSGGDRSVVTLAVDEAKINAGYKIRFESAVENKGYHVTDVEVPLTIEGLSAKTDGRGFIRYVRFSGS